MPTRMQEDAMWKDLQKEPGLKSRRERIEALQTRFLPYADANFISEIRLEFASRFWEMYLGCALLDHGHCLVPRQKRRAAGPDLCINDGGRQIWVEAVAPQRGDGPDSVPEEGEAGWVPESQIVLRYRAAVEEKCHQRRRHVRAGLIGAEDPFVIAVNGSRVPHGNNRWADEIPYAIRAVLPLAGSALVLEEGCGAVPQPGFETRWSIEKASGTRISTAVFLDDEYANVSGLIVADVNPLQDNRCETSTLGLLHNPGAPHGSMLERGWIRGGVEYWVEGNRLRAHRSPCADPCS